MGKYREISDIIDDVAILIENYTGTYPNESSIWRSVCHSMANKANSEDIQGAILIGLCDALEAGHFDIDVENQHIIKDLFSEILSGKKGILNAINEVKSH